MQTLFYRVFWTFKPNVIKIDPYNFELNRFKVGAFFETQCTSDQINCPIGQTSLSEIYTCMIHAMTAKWKACHCAEYRSFTRSVETRLLVDTRFICNSLEACDCPAMYMDMRWDSAVLQCRCSFNDRRRLFFLVASYYFRVASAILRPSSPLVYNFRRRCVVDPCSRPVRPVVSS